MAAVTGAGGWTVTVLPGGATTVVPAGPGVTTVAGEALGAGTITVVGAWAATGAIETASRPSAVSAAHRGRGRRHPRDDHSRRRLLFFSRLRPFRRPPGGPAL